ncbi:MAG: hypothetical protein K2M31_06460 [Muribaculaceae bacterium]|nr:hypothetical protein [Muribaculaceae bacterium]
MNDDKLKSLFADFEPQLSPDSQFIDRLERSLNSVEIIRQHAAGVRKRNRVAVGIATFSGFIIGVLFSLMLPYLSNAVAEWQLTLSNESLMHAFADQFSIIAWSVVGASSVITALNAYEISLQFLAPRTIRKST